MSDLWKDYLGLWKTALIAESLAERTWARMMILAAHSCVAFALILTWWFLAEVA